MPHPQKGQHPITGPVSFFADPLRQWRKKISCDQQVYYQQNNQVFNGRTFSRIKKAGLPAADRNTGRVLVKTRILSLY
jgi:hypothetical protein